LNRHDVFLQVHDDLKKRDALGWKIHRKPLDARDPGIDFLQEAYEEALDLVVYLKGELLRRKIGIFEAQDAREENTGC
jgi:hypothetical protein